MDPGVCSLEICRSPIATDRSGYRPKTGGKDREEQAERGEDCKEFFTCCLRIKHLEFSVLSQLILIRTKMFFLHPVSIKSYFKKDRI